MLVSSNPKTVATAPTTSASRAQRRRERVAYHEAGHAVASVYLGLPLRKRDTISTRPDATSSGRVSTRSYMNQFDAIDLDRAGFSATKAKALNRMVSIFAGPVAEQRHCGGRFRLLAPGVIGSDHDQLTDLAFQMGGEGKRVSLIWQLCRCEAEAIIDTRWGEIESVARALLEREVLSHDELSDVIISSMDGSMDGPRRVIAETLKAHPAPPRPTVRQRC